MPVHKKRFVFFTVLSLSVVLLFASAVFSHQHSANTSANVVPADRHWAKFLKNSAPLRLQIPSTPHLFLKNGIRVDYVVDTSLPKVNFRLFVEGGAQQEMQIGLNSVWVDMLTFSGSEKYPRDTLATYLETRATSFTSASSLQRSSFALQSFANFFLQDLEVVLEVLQHPRFAPEDLDFLKKQTLRQLEQRAENPAKLAYLTAAHYLWPHSRRGTITRPQDIEKLEREHLAVWQKKMWNAPRMRIVVSGDFDKESLVAMLEKSLLPENPTRERAFEIAEDKAANTNKIFFLSKEIPQSTILFYGQGIKHSSADYYALKVFDYLLGGGSFDSYLTQEIRTKRGWAYSVYSGYRSWQNNGSISIFAQSNAVNTADLINKTEKILQSPEAFVNQNSVAKAKEAISNRFVFLYSTPMQLLSQKLSIEWDGLPPSYLNDFLNNIAKVRQEDVLRVAKKYYQSQNFFIVVVGPQSAKEKLQQSRSSRDLQNIDFPPSQE